MYLLIQLFVDL